MFQNAATPFGAAAAPSTPAPGGNFGGVFGTSSPANTGAGPFAQKPAQGAGAFGAFGAGTPASSAPNKSATNLFAAQTPGTTSVFGTQPTPFAGGQAAFGANKPVGATNLFGPTGTIFGGASLPQNPIVNGTQSQMQQVVQPRTAWKYDDCQNCPPTSVTRSSIYDSQRCARTRTLIDLNSLQVIHGQGTRLCGYNHQPPQAPYWTTKPIKSTDDEEGPLHRRLTSFVYDLVRSREDGIGLLRWTFQCSIEEFEVPQKGETKSRREQVLEIMHQELKFGNETVIIDQPAQPVEYDAKRIGFVFEVRFKGGPLPPEKYHPFPAVQVKQHIESLGPQHPAWQKLMTLGIVMKGTGGAPQTLQTSPQKPTMGFGAGLFPGANPQPQQQQQYPQTDVVWSESNLQGLLVREAPSGVNQNVWDEVQNKARALTKSDKNVYNPKVVRGFKGLKQRVETQEAEIIKQEQQLEALSKKVEAIKTQQHILDMDINAIKAENSNLTQEILHLISQPRRVNQFFDHSRDQELKGRIDAMERDLSDPRHALGQLQDLIAKHQLQDSPEDWSMAQSLIPQPPHPVVREFTQHLKTQQEGIDRMVDVIKEDAITLDLVGAPRDVSHGNSADMER